MSNYSERHHVFFPNGHFPNSVFPKSTFFRPEHRCIHIPRLIHIPRPEHRHLHILRLKRSPTSSYGPFINDVTLILTFSDPLPPLSRFITKILTPLNKYVQAPFNSCIMFAHKQVLIVYLNRLFWDFCSKTGANIRLYLHLSVMSHHCLPPPPLLSHLFTKSMTPSPLIA